MGGFGLSWCSVWRKETSPGLWGLVGSSVLGRCLSWVCLQRGCLSCPARLGKGDLEPTVKACLRQLPVQEPLAVEALALSSELSAFIGCLQG